MLTWCELPTPHIGGLACSHSYSLQPPGVMSVSRYCGVDTAAAPAARHKNWNICLQSFAVICELVALDKLHLFRVAVCNVNLPQCHKTGEFESYLLLHVHVHVHVLPTWTAPCGLLVRCISYYYINCQVYVVCVGEGVTSCTCLPVRHVLAIRLANQHF